MVRRRTGMQHVGRAALRRRTSQRDVPTICRLKERAGERWHWKGERASELECASPLALFPRSTTRSALAMTRHEPNANSFTNHHQRRTTFQGFSGTSITSPLRNQRSDAGCGLLALLMIAFNRTAKVDVG